MKPPSMFVQNFEALFNGFWPKRVMLCSTGFALLALVCLTIPRRPLNQSEAQHLVRKVFPDAVFNDVVMKVQGQDVLWNLRFTSPALSNANLVTVNAATREIVCLTRWPSDEARVSTPRFAKP